MYMSHFSDEDKNVYGLTVLLNWRNNFIVYFNKVIVFKKVASWTAQLINITELSEVWETPAYMQHTPLKGRSLELCPKE